MYLNVILYYIPIFIYCMYVYIYIIIVFSMFYFVHSIESIFNLVHFLVASSYWDIFPEMFIYDWQIHMSGHPCWYNMIRHPVTTDDLMPVAKKRSDFATVLDIVCVCSMYYLNQTIEHINWYLIEALYVYKNKYIHYCKTISLYIYI